MNAKPFVRDRIELHAIDALSFLANVDDAESWSHLPIEHVTAHAQITGRFTDPKNSRRYGVLHGILAKPKWPTRQ